MRQAEADVGMVLELGHALQRHGIPTRRIEDILELAAARLGMRVDVFATMTALIVRFGPAEELRTTFLRFEPADVDLGAVRHLDRIVQGFLEGTASADEPRRELARLETRPLGPRLSARLVLAGLGAVGWTGLLGGGLRETGSAALAAVLVELLTERTERHRRFTREFTALAGMLVGACVTLCSAAWGPLVRETAIIAALIAFLPGFSLVMAADELASKDVVTGSARLVSAGLVFAQLIFGVAMGTQLERLWPAALGHGALAQPSWLAQLGMLVPALAGLALRLRVELRDLGWFYAAGAVGLVSGRAATQLVGLELAAFLGALAVGVLGNASARWLRSSALLTIVPGILVLVPGSLGLHSASALFAAQHFEGIRSAFSALIVAVALATGLILANSVVSPRRSL